MGRLNNQAYKFVKVNPNYRKEIEKLPTTIDLKSSSALYTDLPKVK